ncbi:MAG: histidine phosphatase family protein [Alphaproteobacteria bacterium]|nr:histidine phosphatase family protein [Alphaproteobacteria bacterium]
MTILLIRHGETEWNRARRHQGRFDSPLTARGLAQAHAIGRRLAGLPEAIAAPIVSSPQGRARHTAKIICEELGGQRVLRLDARLREHSVGVWDGLTYSEIERQVPGIFDGDGGHPPEWYFRGPGSESYAAFAERIGHWLEEQDAALPVIVVAHGLVSRVLRGLYAGLPPAEALVLPVPQDRIFRLSEGRIETFDVEPQPTSLPGAGRSR